MQELILKSLKLQNFKGIKDLEINFNDETVISGANATGKTTIFDAYSWLLWDKDSFNRKDFNIKPFAENGEVKHGLETVVTGVFEAEGSTVELMKNYHEKWAKKRGNTDLVFDGNTTDYYINSVPIKKSEYNARIESLISEREFNLLSNPIYFNQILDKKERRDVLLSLITDVKKEDVLACFEDLKELDLDNYKIDEIKTMAKATSKKINKDIEDIPIRISELENTKKDYNFKKLESEKKEFEKELKNIDNLILKSSKSADIITEKNNLIQDYSNRMRDIKREVDDFNEDEERKILRSFKEKKEIFEDTKNEVKKSLRRQEDKLDNLKEEIKHFEKLIAHNDEDIKTLRQKWVDINSKEFDGSLVCPTCKREFDEDKKDEILADFNKQKAENLLKIEKEANEVKEEREEFIKKLEKTTKDKDEVQERIKELEKEYNDFGEFEDEKPVFVKKELPDIYFNLEKEIEKIKEDLQSISENDNTNLLEDKKRINDEINALNSRIQYKVLNEELEQKINVYIQKEKELATHFEEQSRVLYLCDEYIRIYTNLVQDKVNDLFKVVNFRLFETQVNGELKETCEVTVNGVPYSDVNNAGKINAGLDVINSLSKFMQKRVPIFVDNAESVNKLIDVNSQIIKLYVSEEKELKIK